MQSADPAHFLPLPPPPLVRVVTYNGVVLHSKLKTGQFPDAGAVVEKLREVMTQEQGQH